MRRPTMGEMRRLAVIAAVGLVAASCGGSKHRPRVHRAAEVERVLRDARLNPRWITIELSSSNGSSQPPILGPASGYDVAVVPPAQQLDRTYMVGDGRTLVQVWRSLDAAGTGLLFPGAYRVDNVTAYSASGTLPRRVRRVLDSLD